MERGRVRIRHLSESVILVDQPASRARCCSITLASRKATSLAKSVLRQRLQLRRLAVDDLEHDIARLQLPVRQERCLPKYRSLDRLAADRFGDRLAVKALGRLDRARPDLKGGRAERRALVRFDAVGLLECR